MKNIAGVDLNLLVAFDALMRARHVTRAASLIGLAQPSMSNALARLRALFDDELFVRTPAGMQPTPEAERIAPFVADALKAVDLAINKSVEFDPATTRFSVRLATTDYFEFICLPAILKRLHHEAPLCTLGIVPFDRDTIAPALDRGDIDLAIGVTRDLPQRLQSTQLFEETFVCIARSGHPDIPGPLQLETFLRLSHALVSLRGDGVGVVDAALAKQGLSRQVAASTASFLSLPFLIAQSDLIAVTARRLAVQIAGHAGLKVYPVPIRLKPFAMTMVWGKGTERTDEQKWFRDLVASVVSAQIPSDQQSGEIVD